MDVYTLDTLLQQMTPHQLKLIQAMYDSDGKWLTRSGVAKAIRKKRLTPYDIDILHMLGEKGILELSTRPTTAPGSDFAYIYCMTDEMAQLLQEWSDFRDNNPMYRRRRRPIRIMEDGSEESAANGQAVEVQQMVRQAK
jgi:hypothetical protein